MGAATEISSGRSCAEWHDGLDWSDCRHTFRVCQTTIAAPARPSGLPPAVGAPVDLRFIIDGRPHAPDETVPPSWFHHYRSRRTGALVLSCARLDDGFLLRSHGEADFVVTATGDRVSCHPAEGVAGDGPYECLIDTILPLVLTLAGRDGIHATAVDVSGAAVAFTGVSKLGKSTLAAYFHHRGYPVVTDEYLGLRREGRGVSACRGAPWMRLWRDSVAALEALGDRGWRSSGFTQKATKTVNPALAGQDALSLKRVYCLSADRSGHATFSTSIEPMARSDAFFALVAQAYRLELRNPTLLERQSSLFAAMANLNMVRRLSIGSTFDRLDLTLTGILTDLNS